MLGALARALQLDEDATAYLHRLANPPAIRLRGNALHAWAPERGVLARRIPLQGLSKQRCKKRCRQLSYGQFERRTTLSVHDATAQTSRRSVA
jgi:hypothetical protein